VPSSESKVIEADAFACPDSDSDDDEDITIVIPTPKPGILPGTTKELANEDDMAKPVSDEDAGSASIKQEQLEDDVDSVRLTIAQKVFIGGLLVVAIVGLARYRSKMRMAQHGKSLA